MTTRALAPLVQLLRQYELQRGETTKDAELLQLFISQRDDDAFETLVRRHGPMVLDVCRRILHNEADVEDCFQATFLVLVRKASSLRRRGLVSNWLYGVARNVALKARAMRNLRHRKEKEAAAEKVCKAADHDWHLQELLDQELQALPDKYRAAIVLCDLGGMTVPAAAKQVGCPEGTLSARLVRGRAMLAKRLSRHGLAVSGGVLATALCQNAASACVPGPLVVSTVQAATLMAAGKALATGAISAKVVALTEGVLKAMLMTKIKVAIAVVMALNLIGAGVGLVYCQTAGSGLDKPPMAQEKPAVVDDPKSEPAPSPAQAGANPDQPKKSEATARPLGDLYGDPLPEGAVARLGTLRFRPGDWIRSLALSPDGKTLATISFGDWMRSLALSRGDKTPATVSSGPPNNLKVWNVADGRERRQFQDNIIYGPAAFLPDNKTIALATGPGVLTTRTGVIFVDLETGKQTQTHPHAGLHRAIAAQCKRSHCTVAGRQNPCHLVH